MILVVFDALDNMLFSNGINARESFFDNLEYITKSTGWRGTAAQRGVGRIFAMHDLPGAEGKYLVGTADPRHIQKRCISL